MTQLDTKITPLDLQKIAAKLAVPLTGIERQMFIWRPRICPFHRLFEYVPLGAKVLDVGCGNGLWLNLLSRLGRINSGTGIEIDSSRIESAKKIAAGNPKLDFQVYKPGENWPATECDMISLIDVLHHVPVAQQMDFMGRLLNTSAKRIIFKDIDPSDRFKAAMNTLHDLVVSGQRPRYPAPDEVKNMLRQMGFDIEADFRCDMLWYSHYAIIANRI